jgi:hypothetical protein
MVTARFVRNGAALLLALGCCACATTTPTETASEEPRSKMYRTGSHIPVRDPESSTAKSVDAQAVKDSMLRSGGQGTSPKGQ